MKYYVLGDPLCKAVWQFSWKDKTMSTIDTVFFSNDHERKTIESIDIFIDIVFEKHSQEFRNERKAEQTSCINNYIKSIDML